MRSSSMFELSHLGGGNVSDSSESSLEKPRSLRSVSFSSMPVVHEFAKRAKKNGGQPGRTSLSEIRRQQRASRRGRERQRRHSRRQWSRDDDDGSLEEEDDEPAEVAAVEEGRHYGNDDGSSSLEEEEEENENTSNNTAATIFYCGGADQDEEKSEEEEEEEEEEDSEEEEEEEEEEDVMPPQQRYTAHELRDIARFLDEFKLVEMPVHELSRHNTTFYYVDKETYIRGYHFYRSLRGDRATTVSA